MPKLTCALFLALLVTACQQEEIHVDRVPKEAPMAASPTKNRDIGWTLPAGWTEKPASEMRVASFSASAGAEALDISVVALAGDAGGDLANLNRWRGQIGLPPLVSQDDLLKNSRRLSISGKRFLLVDFANGGKRVLAASALGPDNTWFFKMTGAETAVQKEAQNFMAFLKSLRWQHE